MRRDVYNVFPQISATGDFARLNPVENIVVEILSTLTTSSGEKSTRMWNIDFGSNLLDYIFELSSDENLDALRTEIINSLNSSLPDIVFDQVEVFAQRDKSDTISGVNIFIIFTYDDKKYRASYSFPTKLSLLEGPIYDVKQLEG